MPMKPLSTCCYPGCQRLAERHGYCERHKNSGWQRDKARQAMYDHRWERESKAFLAENPWCVECMKHDTYTAATVVDHVVPHRGNIRLFWDKLNWQGLCKHHHDQKTARGE